MTWNLGSVTATVLDLVEDIPSNISGTRMLEMCDRRRARIEDRTGLTIGSVGIALKYQDVLVNFLAADVLRAMELQGTDANEVRLGDLTVKKGQGGNVETARKGYLEEAKRQLRELGVKISVSKSFG